MNIFRYFDSLLSAKRSLLALKYSNNMDETLTRAYYDICARENKPDNSYCCAACGHNFFKKYIVPAIGTWIFSSDYMGFSSSDYMCQRCLLKHERIVCERCGKKHIVDDMAIRVLHPVIRFSSAEEASRIFPEKNIACREVALNADEFEYLCNMINESEYAKSFQHGDMVCGSCWAEVYFRNDYVQNIIFPKLWDQLECIFEFPDFEQVRKGYLDDTGIDKEIYIQKVNQHKIKNLAKLHELDTLLIKEHPIDKRASSISIPIYGKST